MPRLTALLISMIFLIFFAERCVFASAPIETGVSLELAKERKRILSNLHYQLLFNLKDDPADDIHSQIEIKFELSEVPQQLQLDFKEKGTNLKNMLVNGQASDIDFAMEHLILSGQLLKVGANVVRIDFIAGKSSLNRNDDYLYTLFVPDRARTAFPLFDQPNLKATFDLTLTMPAAWQSIANGPVAHEHVADGVKTTVFKTSDRISSYLFSFVAGRFDIVERKHNGQIFRMLHRETDAEKLEHNVDEIFKQHYAALQWLENYTGIKYPFQKMDFALIPAFQYGGMEHVGAIQYRASRLMLDEDATQSQELTRANLIAHEVAHMWFGNLVTMDWFNDVWTKEVFANFMAAKIVNPSFPEVNHELNFHVRNFPRAYAVDRTEGANAIRQHLPNLNEAGTLYGGIIYNKAPIMMQQLELLLGENRFQEGIREYLSTFAGANATWPGLVDILDRRSEHDLKAWSEVWVNSPRMPVIDIMGAELHQRDPLKKGRAWPQQFVVRELGKGENSREVQFFGPVADLELTDKDRQLFNIDGKGYGIFPVNVSAVKREWQHLSELERATVLVNAYEQMLNGNKALTPVSYYDFLFTRIADEPNQLVQDLALDQIETIFWSFLTEQQRTEKVPMLEAMLLKSFVSEPDKGVQKRFFRSFQSIALTRRQLSYLYALWKGDISVEGLELSEADKIQLASTLAIKIPKLAYAILKHQHDITENQDRKRRFAFVAGALSPDESVREAFFNLLKEEQNREVESWVLSALTYLHHPLRREHAERFILPSMALLEEVQKTGDIFFPTRWIGVTLSNHRSKQAVDYVDAFLKARPDYNYQLKLKLLQAADKMKRAYILTGGN